MKYRTECNEVRAVLLGCLCLNDRVRRYADNALFPEERPRERGGVALRCQVHAVRAREHGDIDPVVNKKPCAEGGCQFPDALRGLQELPCGERLFAELYYPHAAPQGSLYLFEERLPRRRRAICNEIEPGQSPYGFHSFFANIMIIPRAAIVRLTACAAFSESIIRLSALKCSTMNLPIE